MKLLWKGRTCMMEKSYSFIEDNLKFVNEEISKAAQKSGRTEKDITLLAATKTVDAKAVNFAISKGLNCIGENRVQELLSKYDDLDLEKCDCQFIGRLQTNKIKYLMDKVSQIQSIDSVSQIKELSRLCVKFNKSMKVLVEVNIGREQNKGGVLPEALYEFVDEISKYEGIMVNGLMAIPPICGQKVKLSEYFVNMYKNFVDIRSKKIDNSSISVLSMGMSGDYSLAIECGANLVRVGSLLFGERQY